MTKPCILETDSTNFEKERLDIFVSSALSITRSSAANLIKSGNIKVNQNLEKAGYIVKQGDSIEFFQTEKKLELVPQDIPLDILFEDKHILVINKARGLTVHAGGGATENTLVNALLFKGCRLSDISGTERAGIVHRLDKETSGVMVVAKTNEAHLKLSQQFSSRQVKKVYLAILEGNPIHDSGKIETFITRDEKDRKKMRTSQSKGKMAVTVYKVLRRFEHNSLVEFNILTGRTHQIRVHAKFMGHAVVGDKLYGHRKQKFNVSGQLLHAKILGFLHPATNKEMVFVADENAEFKRILQVLN